MKFKPCDKETFEKHITDHKDDRFAKTFVSKANMQGLWENCIGLYEGDELLGAITYSISKRIPYVCNLQLLHTFQKHRRKGVAKKLCNWLLDYTYENFVTYLRVSSEIPAIPFYESLGMVMLGEQKSGCQLSACKITSKNFSECEYNVNDPVIKKMVYRKGKGGCVKVFIEPDKEDSLDELF